MEVPINAEEMEDICSDPRDLDVKKSSDDMKTHGHLSMKTSSKSKPIGALQPTRSLMKSVGFKETQAPQSQNSFLKSVLTVIDAGADVNKTDEGETALFYAVQIHNESTVRALIDAGADVNITDNEGKTALFYAVQQSNNESVVRALIDACADVNITDNKGRTALFYAVQIHNESAVRALIDAGADVNKTYEGETALVYAVQIHNESAVRALIDAGADVNITDNEGKPALVYAVQIHNKNAVLALIDAGANITNEGKTAFFYAVQSNNESAVRALIEQWNSLTSPRDIYGRTPLFYAMTKSLSIIQCFLEKNVNMRIKDIGGMSFLSFFVDHCISKPADSHNESCMKQFISERIDLIVEKGVRRNTVYEAIIDIIFCKCPLLFHSRINVPTFSIFLELAKTYSTENDSSKIDAVLKMVTKTVNDKTLYKTLVPQILDLLCELGADPNSADTEGNTALHYATCLPFYGVSKEAIMDMLKKLEEAGVTVDAKNHQSETPLLFCLTWHSNDPQLLQENCNQLSAIKILVEVCHFLMENGSNVEKITDKGETVLHLIMRLLQKILEWHGETRLNDVVKVGIELFISFSSTSACRRVINRKDENLNLPIHLWASLEPPHQCLRGDADGRSVFSGFIKEVLNKLLECGTQLDERNKHGQTPLHLCRTWSAVELLIDSRADPNVVDLIGRSPLIVAAQKTLLTTKNVSFYPDVELDPKAFWKTALEKGLDPWIVDEHGDSVLSILIESEALVLAKAMIDVAQIHGCLMSDDISTSLLNAICKNSSLHSYWKSSLVETILKSANLVNINTSLPLELSCRNIIEASKTLSVDEVQMTVHWTIAKQLLSYGADCTIPDERHQSCLDMAEAYPALKELLSRPIDMDQLPMLIPWSSVSKKYQNKLAKVARRLESEQVESYWYHKEHLASGSFGFLFAGISKKDGREVAIKRMEKLRMERPEDIREITNLTALADCDQVVHYLHFFEDKHFSYIVLELMEGNLDELLDHVISVNIRVQLCHHVVKGLNFLHNLSILHRDLKPTNILYKRHPKLCLKIADFGLSRRIDCSSTTVYGTNAGTRCWIAPEVLTSTKAHSKSSDVFACGLVLHYILSVKKHPFAPQTGALQYETETNIVIDRKEGWDDTLSPEAAHLIDAMLDSAKCKRASADEALQHPFFWSRKKKLDFLIAVGNQPEFECPRAKVTYTLTAVENELETKASFDMIVKHGKWNDPGYEHMPAIYTEMMTKKKMPYDPFSVVELVRFIRNATAHVSESTRSTPIRKPLQEDFVFLEYFPNLVIEVYKAVTTHGWDQMREEIKYAM